MFTPKSLFGLIAGCLFLCACSSGVSQPEIASALKEQTPPTPQHWTAAAGEAAVQVGWVESFDDSALVALVHEAQANNHNLQFAAANVERAIALATQAGAALTPSVDLALGGARAGTVQNTATQTTNLGVGLQLGWEIDIWGRIAAGAEGAVASAQAAAADFRFAQNSLAANTAKAYFAAIEARLQSSVVRKTLTTLEETLRIVQLRYDNGMTSTQDLALARADLASAREQLSNAESAARDATRALEILLGRYPSAELALSTSLPQTPPPPPEGLPSELLERRPDLVAAERRVAAAFNLLDQAKAARLPSLSLTSNIGGSSNSLTNILDPQNVAWQLAGNLLAPIFDGGQRRAQVEVATAEQKQALANYGDAAINAFSQVESALDQGVVLKSRAGDLNIVLQQAGEAYRVAQLRYREGEISLLELLTLQQRVDTARSNLLTVNRLELDQRINLHLALGGSWEKE